MSSGKEEKKESISEINQRCYKATWKNYDEESTIKDFIIPFLEALGWTRQTDLKRDINRIDLVLYLEGRPYIGIEAKRLSSGILSETKDTVTFNRDRLLKNCRNIDAKLAVVTRYYETIVYDAKSGGKIAFFSHPSDYEKNQESLEILRKPSGQH